MAQSRAIIKYIFEAHYGEHFRSCPRWRESRKFPKLSVCGETNTWKARLRSLERKWDVDKKQRSDDCVCMCIRVELHVTGS